jgi:ABC-2 type transport system ATP-binding protein
MNPILNTHNLCRSFGRLEAVHNVSLSVEEGSVYALLGHNGAGKTTTIKLIMNLLRPTGGTSTVLGIPSAKLGPRELAKIGYVSENQKQPDWMRVGEFLDFCRPMYPTWDRDLEKKLLRQFDLPLDRKLKQLSKGMKMKALLLSSLAYRPRLLVLDEPFSGLDPLVREELIGGMLEITEQEGWTVFISSHDMDEVERLADTVGVINEGVLHFSENIDLLKGRFHRVTVDGITGQNFQRESLPPNWLGLEADDNRLRFVDEKWNGSESIQRLKEKFPQAQLTETPLGLRDILITLLAHYRQANRKND